MEKSVDLSSDALAFDAYYSAGPEKAIAIVRAARLYQQAVWVADDDPNLAFLWLVSAVEVSQCSGGRDMSHPVSYYASECPRYQTFSIPTVTNSMALWQRSCRI